MNPTGVKPVQFSVLIEVEEVEGRTTGGLWLTEETREREQMQHDRGKLVDVADMAFSDWNGRVPKIGDKVIFKKYAGTIINFRDDNRNMGKFRLCNDKEVFAIIEEKGE